MPELMLLCGCDEHVCVAVTVSQYRKYMEIMERDDGAGAAAAMRLNEAVLKTVFNVSSRELNRAEVVDYLTAAKTIHFVMQEIITKKFLDLNPEHPEKQEKSAFDDYDEENGYNEADSVVSIWRTCRDNVDRVVKLCIRAFHDSYTTVMNADIMALLDYVAFEIATINEK